MTNLPNNRTNKIMDNKTISLSEADWRLIRIALNAKAIDETSVSLKIGIKDTTSALFTCLSENIKLQLEQQKA